MKLMMYSSITRHIRHAGLLAIFLLLGCAGKIDQRGNTIEAEQVAKLQPGVTGKSDVLVAFGSPTSISTFDPNVWYYISQKTQRRAFFRPEVIDQYVLALSFDKTEKIDAVYAEGFDQYRAIEPIQKATPTSGKKLSLLEQLVGNLGRFNKSANDAGGTVGRQSDR
jgi:outer membrane protein assembly factor BamE (lipoprotein component of BamABCDE complex)